MNKLAVFDLDGTLLDTHLVEDPCYARALREAFGIAEVDRNWSAYRHMSDSGIAIEAFERHFGRTPTADDLGRAAARFVELLAEWHGAQAHSIARIAGAEHVFDALRDRGWSVAIATGCWLASARYKLAAGGLSIDGVPIATTEDGPARVDIVRAAIARARDATHAAFDRVVSIGDGVWDVNAARALGLPFVGIARDRREHRLRAAGANVVLAGYTDIELVVAALDDAQCPAAA